MWTSLLASLSLTMQTTMTSPQLNYYLDNASQLLNYCLDD